MVDFGSKLKKLRIQAGLTQKKLDEKIQVTKSVISYYELQERTPSPEILIKLSRIFHVTTDYLLGLDASQTLDISGLDDEDIQLLQHTISVLRNKKSLKRK
ncbi:MAG: helix-turn-helix domain-containing protein [Hominilimicola sp.]